MVLKTLKERQAPLQGDPYKKLFSRGLGAMVYHHRMLAQLPKMMSKFQPRTGENQ
jgi:hypothetical protein